MFCRMAEVYAGFSEYTDAQVGRIVDYLEESGQLENTIIFYCADNGASGEGSPNGSVNEGKIFGGYPDDLEQNLTDGRPARLAGHLQPLPDRLGGGVLHAVPDVQALHLPGRRLRPAGHPLAEGHPGPGRGAAPVPPLHRHRADDLRGLRRRVPRGRSTATSRPRCPGCRWSTRSTTPRRRPRRRRSTTRCSAAAASGTTAGRPSPSTARWLGMSGFDERRLAALPHRRGPSRGARPRRRAPREAGGAQGPLAGGGQGQRRAARSTTCRSSATRRTSRRSSRWSSRSGSRRAGSTSTTPAPREIPERSAANVHNVSYKVLAEVELTPDTQGVIFAHGSRFGGHSLFVKDGQVTYAYNFLGIPPEDRISAPAPTSGRTSSASSSPRSGMGEHREGIGPAQALHRRRGGRPSRRSAR